MLYQPTPEELEVIDQAQREEHLKDSQAEDEECEK